MQNVLLKICLRKNLILILLMNFFYAVIIKMYVCDVSFVGQIKVK